MRLLLVVVFISQKNNDSSNWVSIRKDQEVSNEDKGGIAMLISLPRKDDAMGDLGYRIILFAEMLSALAPGYGMILYDV